MWPGVALAEPRLTTSGEVLMFISSSSLQGGPHFPVALVGPDHGILDPGGFIEGARDIERQAMLVNGKARELRIHHLARRSHCILETTPFGDGRFSGAIKRRDKIARHRNRFASRRQPLQRIAASRRDRFWVKGANFVQRRRPL